MASFRGTDGNDIFTFPANVGDDDIEGEGGDDQLFGGAGADHVDGYNGNDVVDGGAGADRVRGQRGDDLGLYTLAENTRAPGVYDRDVYDGGSGRDALRLHFSAGEFRALQGNIVALESFIRSHQDTSSTSTSSDVTFKTSFGLEARNWESLEVFVDGQKVDPLDPAPRLDLDADDHTAPGTAFQATFNEGGGRVGVVDADVRVLELGGQRIQSATLTILLRPDGAAESLELSDEGKLLAAQLGVQVDKSQPQGGSGPFVLTLTGAASAGDYEQLLRAVGYKDDSQDPEDGDRLIQVVVSDGKNTSDAAFTTVSVVGVNDPPQNHFPVSLAVLEDEAAAIPGSVSDPDASRLRVTLEVEHGTLTLAATDSVAFLEGDGTDDRRIVMEGSPGDLSDRLAGVVYAPDPDFAGSDRLSILTNDLGRQGTGGSKQDLDHVDLTVIPVNDRPSLALQGDQAVEEDAGLQVVRDFAMAEPGGGLDEAGQTFSFLVVGNDNPDLFSQQPEIDPSGTLFYAPAPDASGTATIEVRARDSGGSELGTATSPVRTFTITVEPVDDDPTLVLLGDQIVLEDSGPRTLEGFASAVPGGGADESDQTFVYTVDVDEPELFSAGPAIDPDGNLTFTPNADAAGTSSIKVTATDSGGASSRSERFQITINPVNDRPTLALAGDVIVLEDSGPRSESDFAQANAGGGPDEEGQDFFYTVSADNPGLFAVGPEISPGGRLTFTPAPNAIGSSSVTVQVADDGGTADGGQDTSRPQTFTIHVNPVNDAPKLAILGDQVTIEDSPQQTVPGFATPFPGGGVDEGTQGFSFRVFTMNAALFAKAPAIDSNGTLTYTPRPDAAGMARVVVSVTDSGGISDGGSNASEPKAFTITINPVNDAPTFALAESPIVAEDAGRQEIAGFATANAGGRADESGQTFAYTVVTTSHQALFSDGPSIDPHGTLTFTPQGDASGVASVTVLVTDSGGTAGGGQNQSKAQTFTITVNPVNDPPLLALQGQQIVEEDSGAHSVPDFAVASPGGGPDEATQTRFHYGVNVTQGSEFFEAGPVISSTGTLSYTLKPDAAGSAEVAVTVSDGGGTADGGNDTSAPQTFAITINPVNDRPTLALRGDLSVLEDAGPQSVSGFALPNPGGGADEAAQTFEYTVRNDNPELFALAPTISPDGTLRYETNPDFVGEATVTVIATDSGGTANGGSNSSAPASFTISVNPLNDEPTFSLVGNQIALEDAGLQTVVDFAVASAGGGPDEAAQTFTYRVDADRPELFQQGPALSPGGTLTYAPAPDAVGTAKVSVQVTDSGGTADGGDPTSGIQTFTIALNPVNDPPSLSVAGDQIVNEDTGVHNVAGFARPEAGGGEDERFQKFSYEVITDREELFADGPQIDGSGRLVFKTQADLHGTANVSVRVSDDGGKADGGQNTSDPPVRFRIVVNPVNDAPSLTLLGDRIAVEDSGQQIVAGFATADAGGGETGQTFTYTVTTDKRELFADGPTLASDGTLTFTPQRDATGTASVRVTVTDSGGTANGGRNTSAPQLFTITINPVNDPPSLSLLGDRISNEDAGLQVVPRFATASAGGAPDEAHQTVAYNVSTDDPSLFQIQPTIAPDGTLSYATQKDTVGTANVTVTATDSGGTANGGRSVSDPQTFSITVNPVNDAPSFTLLGSQITVEDAGPRSVSGFAKANPGGGPDEAGQTFFYNVISNNPQLFAEAPAISPAGVLSYTPAADANGFATVSVSVTDSGGTANGGLDASTARTFTITVNKVNDPPVLVVGGDQTVLEDARVQVVPNFARALPGGGSDEIGQTFGYNVTTNALELFAMAPAIDSFGRLSYQPKADAVGTALVQVVAVDDGGTAGGGNPFSDPRTFAIRITGVNDAPLLTLAGNRVAGEDSGAQLVTGFATAFPGGGTDEEVQSFSYDVRSDKPALFAEAPAISPNGTLSFTPARDANGVATVEVTLIDSGGTASGGRNASLSQAFTITLNPANDAPTVTLLGDRSDLEDGGTRTVSRFATADPGGGPDEALQTVRFSVVENDNPGLFAVEPSIDAFGNLTYTLNPDAVGAAELTVVGTDSGGAANGGHSVSEPVAFTITVNPVNDRPSLSLKGAQIVNEDAGVQAVPGFATPSPGGGADEGGQTFTYTVTTNKPSLFAAGPSISPSGDLVYTPQRDTVGSADITVTATDSGGTASGGQNTSLASLFSVAINPVNDPPAFTLIGNQTVLEDAPAQLVRGFAAGNPGGGPDEAAQRLTYTVVHTNAPLFKVAPLISETGTLTYQVNPDAVGTASVTVFAADDGGTANGGRAISASQEVRITVNPVNDAPTFALRGNLVIFEDALPQTVPGFVTPNPGGGADEQGQTFTYTTSTDRLDLFAEAPAIDADGTLTYTARPNAFGLATVTMRATDSGGSADGGSNQSGVQTFTIFVDPINDAPVNVVPSLAILTEDQPLVFAAQSGGRISVSDADAQTLEVSLSVGGGTLTVTTSEGFELSSRELALSASPEALNQLLAGLRYTPAPDFYGTDRLAIVVRDHGESGAGGPRQDVDTVTLSVQAVNDAPFISVPGAQLAAGPSLVFSAGNSNRITIDDSDGGTSDLAATLSVTSGTLSVELEGLRFSGERLSFAADLAALNDALDGLVYVPDPGTSQDRLELLVDDQGNTGRGGALHHVAAVDILVIGDGLGLVGVPEGDFPT